MTEEQKSPVQDKCNNQPLEGVHWMPCLIAKDGVAAVNLYFQPKTNVTSTNVCIENASFRGRGLLATKPEKLPLDMHGHVMIIDTGDCTATIKGSFEYIHEWEHEWDEVEFLRKSSVPEQSRGIEYLEVMRALHDPLPTESL